MDQHPRFARGLLAASGVISFGLGAIGTVLPILPTTPFILLAAFCFARSSDKLNDWFKSTKLYADVFDGFVTKRHMTVKAKLSVIIPITALMGVGFALMGQVPVGRIILAIIWLAHVVYFGFIVKTDRGESGVEDGHDAVDGDAAPPRKREGMPMVRTELFGLLGDARRYIWIQVGFKFLALVSQVAIALAAASLVQLAFEGRVTSGSLAMTLGIVAAGVALRVVADRGESRTAHLASIDVKRTLRSDIYAKLLRLGASYRESIATSKVVQLAVEGVEQLETYFSLFIPQLFHAFLAPVALFAVVGPLVSWKAAGILLLSVPLIPISLMAVQTVAKRLLSRYWGSYTRLGDTFLENLQGLTTLKVYQADEHAARRMDEDSEDFRITTMNVLKMQLSSTTVMDIGAYGGAAAGMIMVLMELFAGNVSAGGAMVVLLLAAEFFLPMRRLGSYFHVGMNGMAASDSIFDLLGLPERAAEGTRDLEAKDVSFALDGVTFSYDGERTALEDVSMVFPAGSFTSIVGASGCGKSTVANLLMGRNHGHTGTVQVNGEHLADLSEESLMRHVTLVSRTSHVFKGSVRDNLLLGAPDADDARLSEALATVGLLDFINGLGGLDAPMAEGGTNLSGGQRQRLVLARALLHDTPAYIFDEATSNVDVESEALIMDVVRDLARTRTVILISHRLANVVASDAVYMMEAGRVVESGTHDELMAADGRYARLFDQQAELERYARAAESSGSARRTIALREEAVGSTAADERGTSGPSAPDAVCGTERASALSIMGRLIRLVRSMTPVMCLAIALGVVGFLCAIFLTVFAGYGVVSSVDLAAADAGMGAIGSSLTASMPTLYIILACMAVARGLLHYGEQYCNHHIAFKMLAIVRHKVFAKLRTLAPAKLEGRDKGDLISLITGDIELLEVFYAHTISPIAIATLVSCAMVVFLWIQHWVAGIIGLAAYLAVGVALPAWNARRVGGIGLAQRDAVGDLNAFVLDSLYGIEETIQYDDGPAHAAQLDGRSRALAGLGGQLSSMQGTQLACTDLLIQVFSWGMLFTMLGLWMAGSASLCQVVIATLAMMGSFGPVVALSNLSTTLAGTLASGHRVLQLLDEQPAIPEQSGYEPCTFAGASLDDVSFSYGDEPVLSHCSLDVPCGRTIGICGPSGCGKSTICKLVMRFWDVRDGEVRIGERDVRGIDTMDLRSMESYVTQDTWLFHESIAENILVGKPGATREEVVTAARKASLDGFIESLPHGYDTLVGELGDTLSDGERQRVGLARAFLHDAPLMLLDEPTSNLDSLNEATILRSLSAREDGKTVVLVSHRVSTMALADTVLEVQTDRAS